MSVAPTASTTSPTAGSGESSAPGNVGAVISSWSRELSVGNQNIDTAEIRSLIEQLNRLPKGPQSDAFIQSLSDLLNNQPTQMENPMQGTLQGMAQSIQALRIVLAQLPFAGLDESSLENTNSSIQRLLQDLEAQHQTLGRLSEDLTQTAVQWSNNPDALIGQMNALITQLNALKTANPALPFRAALEAMSGYLSSALQTYNTAVQNITDLNGQQAMLALSKLREAFYQAKVDFLSAVGYPSDASEMLSAQTGVRSEQLRQTQLLSPTEDVSASPRAVTLEEMDRVLEDLNLQYQLAVSHGNRDAMAHLEAKIRIVGDLRNMLLSGTEPLLIGLVMFQELRFLDITHKRVMQARLREQMVELQRRNDPNLEAQIAELTQRVDGLEAEIDSITRLISQVMNQYEAVLNTWSQTQVDAFSKAF